MPIGDKTKKPAFMLWLTGKPLADIQKAVCSPSGTKPNSVRGWVQDWERGKQGKWVPNMSER